MLLGPIKQYIKRIFGDDILTDAEIHQLSWNVRSGQHTPERVIADTSPNDEFVEVRRASSRLYCLALLRQGPSSYKAFTDCQEKEDIFLPKLTAEQYQDLCAPFVDMDELTYETLKVSTIISSLPLSPQACENAQKQSVKYSYDSVEFLADTFDDIEKAKNIYPLVNDLFAKFPQQADQQRITNYLHAAFAHRRHYRHMLYTEGNHNMFNGLLAAVKSGSLLREGFNFWCHYWTINITGFRGNIAPKGSYYLTSNTFKAMRALESVLKKVFQDPQPSAQALFAEYLELRASFLGLDQASAQQKRILAHLAAMMRLFHPEEGEILANGLKFVPDEILKEYADAYFDAPADEPTPTYMPALYDNCLTARRSEYQQDSIVQLAQRSAYCEAISKRAASFVQSFAICDTVAICWPLCAKALAQYRQLNLKTPLSFRNVRQDEIRALAEKSPITKVFNILDHLDPQVNEKGEVSLTLKPRLNEKAEDPLSLTPTITPSKHLQKEQADIEGEKSQDKGLKEKKATAKLSPVTL